ncbi:hypothetical protein QYE76_039235 [Lolium multiflorum]|uniref:Sulfotransferase n=1 Tax=Lolium multiflorum TaxID=4521 RepID=A0AAD8TAL3_LOLMU|nr:hypothetical protein QYE76_039235 [Lolium multiflorum]
MYWDTVKRWPEKVLFVRYKKILHDPTENIRRIAEFIECPFTVAEWAADMVYTSLVQTCKEPRNLVQ